MTRIRFGRQELPRTNRDHVRGSRGIGLAIARAIARRGGNVVLLAKTDTPDPRLPGTIHTAVDELNELGGHAVPVVGDVRNDDDIAHAVDAAVEHFGGIDIVVNNASVLDISKTEDLAMKRFDLMQQVNVRGTFALTRACLPYLRVSANAHVLTLSPPLNFSPHWLGAHPGYMLAKYGMTLAALGIAAEYSGAPISSNCLWPETMIATAAVGNLLGETKVSITRVHPRSWLMRLSRFSDVPPARIPVGRCSTSMSCARRGFRTSRSTAVSHRWLSTFSSMLQFRDLGRSTGI